jgi:hypothetical protein
MIALVSTANTVDEWRIVTNQLIIRSDDTVGAYDQANTAYDQATAARNQANTARNQANTAYDRGNTAFDHANAAYSRANTANTLPVGNTTGGAFTVRSTRNKLNFIQGSNITINVDDYSGGDAANITITSTAVSVGDPIAAYDQANAAYGRANTAYDHGNNAYTKANTAYNQATAAYARANTAYDHGNTAYDRANTAYTQGNNAYTKANTAYDHAAAAFTKANTANNIAVGNTLSSTFTQRSARARLNFIPGTNITVNVDDDTAGDRVNVTITSTAADGIVASQAFDRANTANAKANAALANATGTFAGDLTITQNVSAKNVRATTQFVFPNGNVITNFTVSTSSPAGGINGDIWLKIV